MRDFKLVDTALANTIYTEIYDAKINKQPIPKITFKYLHDMDLNKYDEAKEYRNIVVKKILEVINENIDNIDNNTLDRIINRMYESKLYKRNVKIKGINGEYYVKENAMVLNNKKSVYYQSLILSSSEYDFDKDIQYSGFRKIEYGKHPYNLNDIGIGINVGYTQYQALKIFGDPTPKNFKYESEIAQKVEKIIGKDIMRKLYFEHDYLGLVNELRKHFKYKDVLNILLSLDYIMFCKNSIYLENKKEQLIEEKKKIIERTIGSFK